jgi:hypothetical protein
MPDFLGRGGCTFRQYQNSIAQPGNAEGYADLIADRTQQPIPAVECHPSRAISPAEVSKTLLWWCSIGTARKMGKPGP